jgi:hypothetical protein
MPRSRRLRIVCGLIVCCFWNTASLVRGDFQDGFESSKTVWKLRHSDCQARILVHERQFQDAHSGAGCEHLEIRMGRGTYAHLSYDIPPVRVIDELKPGLWIKSNGRHLQLLVRVVLPRTIDPQSGKPLKFLIRGSRYELVGQWQRLSINRCRESIMSQIPSLRSQFGSTVDPKQAFIDMIVLNTYAGPGTTKIWTDDLRIATPIISSAQFTKQDQPDLETSNTSPILRVNKTTTTSTDPGIQLQGPLLLVEKRPFFPRIIEYNGESFQWLQKLGFNTVALKHQPTADQIVTAKRLGMWLIVPPKAPSAGHSLQTIRDRCLAFDLGNNLTQDDLPAISQTVSSIRDLESPNVPLLAASPVTLLNSYSRQCDLLRLPWAPLYQSADLNAATRSLREQVGQLRHGTSYWVTIPTQPSAALISQWNAFGTRHLFPREVEPEQIRFLAFSAVASGARGLYFRSWSRLDAPDTSTGIRCNTLELVNQEIRLIEPWLAGGVYLGDLDTGAADVRGSLWQTERAKLLILLRSSAGQQYVSSPTKSKLVSLEVPGTPLTYRPYHLQTDGPRNIQLTRGNQTPITMQADERVSLVVLTPDQLVRDYLYEQTSRHRQRLSHLRLKLAIDHHSQFKQVISSIPLGSKSNQVNQVLRISEQHLSQAQTLLNSGDRTGASQFTGKADQSLRQLRWELWNEAVRFFPSPISSPYCVCFQTLPNHWELVEQMKNGQWGNNILKGSDFENLTQLQQEGWLHRQQESTQFVSRVELSADQPHAGNYCLHLSTQPHPKGKPADLAQRPSVQITTGPVDVKVGSRLRIRGWARVSSQVNPARGNLLVYDSLGGRTLGDRVHPTIGWQEFLLYRAAPRSGPFQVTFTLDGPGEAWIDSVSIQILESSPPAANFPAPSNN